MSCRALLVCAAALAAWAWAATGPVLAEEKTTPEAGYEQWRVGLGAQNIGLDGNERRFEQYVIPPAGVFLDQLSWERWEPGTPLFGQFLVRQPGEPGAAVDLWAAFAQDLVLKGEWRRSRAYRDFQSTSLQTRRWDGDVTLRSPSSRDGLEWSIGAREVDILGRPATGPVDWNQRDARARLDYRFGHYTVSARYERQDFDLRTGGLFSGDAESFGLSFASSDDSLLAIAGDFTRQRTDLDGRGRGLQTSQAALSVHYPVTDAFSLSGILSHYKIDHTITQNAYARRNTSLRLEADYSYRGRATLRGFWETGHVEYVDGRHLNEYGAAVNTLGASLKARVSPELSADAGYRRRDTSHRPLAYDTTGSLTDTLVYSTAERKYVTLTFASRRAPVGLTGQWRRDSWENDVRAVKSQVDTTSLTGWWQVPGDQLTITGSVVLQDFDLPIWDAPLVGGNLTSMAKTFTLGLHYQYSPTTSFSANLVDVATDGASVTDFKAAVLGVEHRYDDRNTLAAEINLGSFDDLMTSDLGYDAHLVRLSWTTEF